MSFLSKAGRIPRRGCVAHAAAALWGVILSCLCLVPAVARAGGGPQNVLVVIDEAVPDSVTIGEYYAAARDIPEGNILRLNSPQLGDFSEVLNNLGTPIKDYCVAEGIEDQIDYVVLTKGIPYTFSGMRDSVSSILYSEATHTWSGTCDEGVAATENPYFRKAQFFDYNEQYAKGSIPLRNRRLVMMLSELTPGGAMINIDAGVASDESDPAGTVYFFSAVPGVAVPRLWPRHSFIPNTRASLTSLGVASEHFVVSSEDDANLFNAPDVMGYLTGAVSVEFVSNTYLAGAVADHLTSFGGDLLDAGGQMSILEFTDAGVTGSSGTVTEPCNFPSKFVNPILYERYAAGFNLAETMWMSLDQPWQTMMVGDPLAQPWAVKPVVTINSPQAGQSVGSSPIDLDVTATHPRVDFLSRMDLFVDGRFDQTLAGLGALAGNVITLTANGTLISYTCVGGEDSFDILKGLMDNAGSTPGVELFRPAASIGRSAYVKVRSSTAGAAGNGIPVSIGVSQGAGTELAVAGRVSSATLVGGTDADVADELDATKAQSHVFVTVGAPVLTVTTQVDLSSLAEGMHELRVVAYQGDAVFTQGYAKVMVDTTVGLIGDIDGNGAVDLFDFATFARCFGRLVSDPPPSCLVEEAVASDLNEDARVNLADFGIFALHFGEQL